jgi:hypothetical protein
MWQALRAAAESLLSHPAQDPLLKVRERLYSALRRREHVIVAEILNNYKNDIKKLSIMLRGGEFNPLVLAYLPPNDKTGKFKGADYGLAIQLLKTRAIFPSDIHNVSPRNSLYDLVIQYGDLPATRLYLWFEADEEEYQYHRRIHENSRQSLEYGRANEGRPEHLTLTVLVKKTAEDFRSARKLMKSIDQYARERSIRKSKIANDYEDKINIADHCEDIYKIACGLMKIYNICAHYQNEEYRIVRHAEAKLLTKAPISIDEKIFGDPEKVRASNPTRYAIPEFFAETAWEYGCYAYALLRRLDRYYRSFDGRVCPGPDPEASQNLHYKTLHLLRDLALAAGHDEDARFYQSRLEVLNPALTAARPAHGGAGYAAVEPARILMPRRKDLPNPLLAQIELPPELNAALSLSYDSDVREPGTVGAFATCAGAGRASSESSVPSTSTGESSVTAASGAGLSLDPI